MEKLPLGFKPTEDETIIYHLVNDQIFKESIECEYGTIVKIFADWHQDQLVYEFLNGSEKYSCLSGIVKALKDMGYIKEFMN